MPPTRQKIKPAGAWRSLGFGIWYSGFILTLLLCAATASACSVPVFRYALERWEPAAYELVVFHRGPLSPGEQQVLGFISTNAEDKRVNLSVRTADLAGGASAEMLQLWSTQKLAALPAMVLRKPRASAADLGIWSGPLTEASATQLLDSPARRRISERLLKGDSAVWVLLESGDKEKDDAAETLLKTRVALLEKTLKLPEIAADDLAQHKIAAAPEELKVAFSVARLSRTDPAEQVLAAMLLSSEDDLDDEREPLAFPVFGRGRALFALVGKGINHETIDEACSFVIGPCSCVVKDLNPGIDLVLMADWGGVARSEDDPLDEAALSAPRSGARVAIPPGLPEEKPKRSRAAVFGAGGMAGRLGGLGSNRAAMIAGIAGGLLLAGALGLLLRRS